jgi:dipeptidyl aminopeptidase/acylaminoacyl peptidase
MVHGGPHGYCEPSIDLLKYILLKCGYMILFPCYTGTIGFGQKFLKGAIEKLGDIDAKEIL